MEAYNNQHNNVVVKDGHPASFRNADGSLKNIYTDDGSLTEEGKEVMAARESLSRSNEDNKKGKSKRKQIAWAVSAVIIVFFLLFFHISLVTDKVLFPKASPTFSNTFITPATVNEIIERLNNASFFEQLAIQNEPFVKLLFDEGILYREGDEKRQEKINLDFLKEMVANSNQTVDSYDDNNDKRFRDLDRSFQKFFKKFTKDRKTQISLIKPFLVTRRVYDENRYEYEEAGYKIDEDGFVRKYFDKKYLEENWEFRNKDYFIEIEVNEHNYQKIYRYGGWTVNSREGSITYSTGVSESCERNSFTFKKINGKWRLAEYFAN